MIMVKKTINSLRVFYTTTGGGLGDIQLFEKDVRAFQGAKDKISFLKRRKCKAVNIVQVVRNIYTFDLSDEEFVEKNRHSQFESEVLFKRLEERK